MKQHSAAQINRAMKALRTSVRPIVTFAFALALVAGFLVGRVPENVFTTIAGSVITFWFGQRINEDRRSSEE